ncbi:MAG: ROK family protein [Verrucomicrobiia bacterium]
MGESNSANINDYYVGVDFGGTKILSGVFDQKLECLGTTKISTKAYRGTDAVVARIVRCILEAVDECDLNISNIKAVGIGAPGAVDTSNGEVIFAPNLGWQNVPLKKELEKVLNVPVFLDNDCNVNTLGVYEVEFDRKPSVLIGVFIGTGIGAGIIINGELYSGFNKTAGEVGHIVIDIDGPKCGCGNKGCLEAFASRSAIVKKIRQAIDKGETTILTEIASDEIDDIKSGTLRKAAKRGDELVIKVVREAAFYIGVAMSNLINIFSPEVLVLGGGVIEALEKFMMPDILRTIKDYAFPGTLKNVKIETSTLGDNAGIIGAAVLAKNSVNISQP